MFTGIVEAQGAVLHISHEGTNTHFTLEAPFTNELRVDQSLAHDGVCLTVTELFVERNAYRVTAIAETLGRTTLGLWAVGSKVNLERCMPANGRFDGHIVQGHVDTTATVSSITDMNGSFVVRFEHEADATNITVEKGSICVNGVSLTVVESGATGFSVAIIPYTWEHTNFGALKTGDKVNLEFDVLGKYVARMLAARA